MLAGVLDGSIGGIGSAGWSEVRGIGGGDLVVEVWAVLGSVWVVVGSFWKMGVVVNER